MGQMKTPGVYIVEKNAFPSSVVEVATAVPAFIGYTERADNRGKPLTGVPWRITSMAEFHRYFGLAPTPQFELKPRSDATEDASFKLGDEEYIFDWAQGNAAGRYLLYYSMLLFFQNGGGPCYVVSVGHYGEAIETDRLSAGIEPLLKEQEPTLLVIPDAMLLDRPNSITVQQAMLQHCGSQMKNRFALLDVWGGNRSRQHPLGDCIEQFRGALGINFLDFAAAYYPWINTTVVQDKDLSYQNIANGEVLARLIRKELGLPETADEKTAPRIKQQLQAVADITRDWSTDERQLSAADIQTNKLLLNKTLISLSPLFSTMLAEMRNRLNLLPPAAAMAGIYTMVDNTRGVWKAPANVSINGVIAPAVNLSSDDQEDLNVTTQGKSINAIRSFIGEGVLVWGARTLDGNSLDWRYINVRRTMIMLEESCRLAGKAMVFEPNVANTWVTIKSMIGNFLSSIWKRGGLAGAVPEDAFSVHVGLGETMTPEDILEGILRVSVLVALTRPAEFIEITFQQQMQKS